MAIGNKDVEVLSEAMFCYYFAIWKMGKQKNYNIGLILVQKMFIMVQKCSNSTFL